MNRDRKAMRADERARKDNRRDEALAQLRAAGVGWETGDNAHLIVEQHLDYWPRTGLWSDRRSSLTGKGVASLLRALGKGHRETESSAADRPAAAPDVDA